MLKKRKNPYMIAPRGSRAAHWIAVLCAILLLFSAVYYCLPVHGEDAVYDAVIRLHVLANSDSSEDQADKLAVRDAVLSLAAKETEDCATREAAEQRLRGMIPQLEACAREVLLARGRDHSVTVTLGQEDYPGRSYDSFCFPSGQYLSLRVLIGQAEGQNFWCVLFPPMCLGAATVAKEDAEDAMISVGLSKEQYSIITETGNTKYKLRFRILEWLQGVW